MFITGDEDAFPNNAVELIHTRMTMLHDDLFVTRRPLRAEDPQESIGVFPSLWTPDPESYEIWNDGTGGAPGSSEPSLGRYVIGIQAFIKDMDEEVGSARHSILSTIVRGILYRDQSLRIALASLNVEVSGVRERVMKWGVTTQRFLSNEIGNNEWLFLSTVEFWLDTEIY